MYIQGLKPNGAAAMAKSFFNVNFKSDMEYGNPGSKEFADFGLEAAS